MEKVPSPTDNPLHVHRDVFQYWQTLDLYRPSAEMAAEPFPVGLVPGPLKLPHIITYDNFEAALI